MTRRAAALIATLPSLATCRPGPTLDRAIDSAGIRVVVAPGAPRPVPWQASSLVALGPDRLPEDLTLERPAQVATDGRETIYLLDPAGKALYAVRPDGRIAWRRGRSGGGPGEFRNPTFLRFDETREIQVTDQGKGTVVRFDQDGTLVGEISIGEYGFPHAAVYLNGDTVLIQETEAAASVLRLKTAQAATELARARIASLGTARFRCGGGTFTMNGAPRIFGPALVWTVAAGKLVVAVDSEYAVRIYQGGQLRAILRRNIAPQRTEPTDVERLYPDGLAVGMRDCRMDAREVALLFGVEAFRPMVRGVLAAPDGSVWIERFTFPDEATQVDVFDHRLTFAGTGEGFGRPAGFLSGGRFVALWPDPASDLNQVRVYQIHPAPW